MEKLNSRKYGMWGVWNNGNTDFVIALLRFCNFENGCCVVESRQPLLFVLYA
jgi:hypothetical protein